MLTVILTGGNSHRMRQDKAMLELNGSPMSLILADRYSRLLGETVFSVNKKGRFPTGDYLELEDVFPGQGPLNGLVSGFRYKKDQNVFLTATDMPGGDPWLAMTLEEMMGDNDICAIQRSSGKVETLFAVYSPRVAESVEKLLRAGRRSVMALYDIHPVRLIREDELYDWDMDKILLNLNTPDEYNRFLRSDYSV